MTVEVAQCLHFGRHCVQTLTGHLRQSLLVLVKVSKKLVSQCWSQKQMLQSLATRGVIELSRVDTEPRLSLT